MSAFEEREGERPQFLEAIEELKKLRHLASPGVEIGHRGGVIATDQNSPTCPGVGEVGN